MSRKCKTLSRKCKNYSINELDNIMSKCLGSREIKKIKSRGRLIKSDYCRHIKLSPNYRDKFYITEHQFKRQAKLSKRNIYETRSSILNPLIKPTVLNVDEPLGNYNILRILMLASQFSDRACVFYPPLGMKNIKMHMLGIKYIVKNVFDIKDILAAKTSEQEKKIVPISFTYEIKYPKGFWDSFDKCRKRFWVSFVSIEANRVHDGDPTYISHHSNVLIYDRKLNQIERFEPLGYFVYYKYAYEYLDKELVEIFKDIDYVSPLDYEPKLGPQKYEIIQSQALDIDDPAEWTSGFCGFWTFIWTFLRLYNPDLTRDQLIDRMYADFRKLKDGIIIFIASLLAYLNDQGETLLLDYGWDPEEETSNKFIANNYEDILRYYRLGRRRSRKIAFRAL